MVPTNIFLASSYRVIRGVFGVFRDVGISWFLRLAWATSLSRELSDNRHGFEQHGSMGKLKGQLHY